MLDFRLEAGCAEELGLLEGRQLEAPGGGLLGGAAWSKTAGDGGIFHAKATVPALLVRDSMHFRCIFNAFSSYF